VQRHDVGNRPQQQRRERVRRAGLVAVAGLAVALATSACGSTSDPVGGAPGSVDASGASPTGPHEFGMSLAELTVRIDVVEASIGRCMADAGFEYVPVDAERVTEAMAADKSAPGLGDSQFVEQYGFGISTQFEPPARDLGLGERNLQIYRSLGTSERSAYDRALLGDDHQATFAITLEGEDFTRAGGCTRAAVETTFTADELSGDYLNPGDVALEQDPRMVAAIASWSGCVADGGFDYARPVDIEDDLRQRLAVISEGLDPPALTGPAAAKLTELQGEELALAKLSTTCEEDLIAPVIDEIETEIYGAPQN